MPLTDLQCLNAKPRKEKYKLADTQGLFLVVMPNGKRYFRYRYRIHGAEKTISFGQYPVTTLAEARDKRFAAKKQVEQGFDPLLVRAEEKQLAAYKAINTFEPIAREWFNLSKYQWEDRHAVSIMYRLEKYIFPHIGKFPVTSITPTLLLSCLEVVKKTSPDIARRVLQYCRRVLIYANTTGRLTGDPTIGVVDLLPKPKRGHVPSIEIDELPSLLQAIENVRFNVSRQTYLATQLMLLVWVRHKELRKAKKTEFNFNTQIWTVPAEHMKMKVEHLVPLSLQAIAIIKELFELNPNSDYLLPSPYNRNKAISNMTLLKFIYLAGYKDKMTIHGFRALATGICQERLKIPFVVIDRQLAHVPENEIRRAYDRAKFLDDRIEMMQRYADYIDKIHPNQSTQRRIHADQRNSRPFGGVATPFNVSGYTSRIGYQISNFAQPLDGRAVSQASQRPGQPDLPLVETGDNYPLQ